MYLIPKQFAHRMRTIYGADGDVWLARLPKLIATCAEKWELAVGNPVPNLSYNYVTYATRRDGTPAMLKIGYPSREIFTEIDTLRLYDGRGMVPLLAVDRDNAAFLLERVIPGTELSELTDDDEATRIMARLIEQLARPAPKAHTFPHLRDWGQAFDRYLDRFPQDDGPLSQRLVEKAAVYLDTFSDEQRPDGLLHGDLHHFNVLYGGGDRWVVIDPKGVVGKRPFETARFLHNPYPNLLKAKDLKQIINRRVDIVCEILPYDRKEVVAWGFCDTILSSVWSVEDGDTDHLPEMCHFAQVIDTFL